jgi:hypothetical protein
MLDSNSVDGVLIGTGGNFPVIPMIRLHIIAP